MARITKEIRELIEEFEDVESQLGYLEGRIQEIYAELKRRGMTNKQLQNRGVHEY